MCIPRRRANTQCHAYESGGGGGSRLTAKGLNKLLNSPFGGSWDETNGYHLFGSSEEGLDAGIAYMNKHNAWGKYEGWATSEVSARASFNLSLIGKSGGGGPFVGLEIFSAGSADDNHISCKSFIFTRGGRTDAQEAGIRNIIFNVFARETGESYEINLPGPFYITVPYLRWGTDLVSDGEAAGRTADALERAGIQLVLNYQGFPIDEFTSASMRNRLETELSKLWSAELRIEFPGSGSLNVQIGYPNFRGTITSNAIINSPAQIIWNKIAGNGCY